MIARVIALCVAISFASSGRADAQDVAALPGDPETDGALLAQAQAYAASAPPHCRSAAREVTRTVRALRRARRGVMRAALTRYLDYAREGIDACMGTRVGGPGHPDIDATALLSRPALREHAEAISAASESCRLHATTLGEVVAAARRARGATERAAIALYLSEARARLDGCGEPSLERVRGRVRFLPLVPLEGTSDELARATDQALRRYVSMIRACYERHLRADPRASGRITIELRVTPAGASDAQTRLTESSAPDEVTQCVLRRVLQVRLPPHEGPRVFGLTLELEPQL